MTFEKITLLFLVALLSSCGNTEKLITFPSGVYISDCFVEGSNSKKIEYTVERNFKSRTVQIFVYENVSNCSGEGVPESDPVTSEVLLIFSNRDLGNGFSYLTRTFEENGVEKTEYASFKFENTRLYFSPPVQSLGENPRNTFADFIAEPDFIAELILTRRDLNRPLSKN